MGSIKNILFITNLHLWSLENAKGGKAFYNTVYGYKTNGWNIWLITTGGGVPDGLINNQQVYQQDFPILDKLWNSRNRFISILARFTRHFLMNHFFIKTSNLILSKKSNFIVYAYEVDGVYAAKKASSKFSFPLVTRFQGTIHASTEYTFNNRIRSTPHLSALATAADLCIMTNDGTKGLETLKRFKNKTPEILFFRNGVEKVEINLLQSRNILRSQFNFEGKIIFLTVSRLVYWKKVDRAILAFSEVIKIIPNSMLVIVGDGNEKQNYISLVQELNLTESVIFVGSVLQSDVKKYIIASDIFLSLYDLSNVGNPLMEALACGKPLITIDVGDTKEMIIDDYNGILLSIDKLNLLPKKMIELATNHNLYLKLANNSLEYANENFWSWDERIKAEIDKVETLLKSSN